MAASLDASLHQKPGWRRAQHALTSLSGEMQWWDCPKIPERIYSLGVLHVYPAVNASGISGMNKDNQKISAYPFPAKPIPSPFKVLLKNQEGEYCVFGFLLFIYILCVFPCSAMFFHIPTILWHSTSNNAVTKLMVMFCFILLILNLSCGGKHSRHL